VLDQFYNADIAVVDMSNRRQQGTLSYHIGVRQHIGAPETVVILHDTDPQFMLSAKVCTSSVSYRDLQILSVKSVEVSPTIL